MTTFDDTVGTQNRDSLYQTIFRRIKPYTLARDNSGFTPSYDVKPSGHLAIFAIGLVLFAWLVIGNGIKDIKKI
jgi:hypothetical protein